MAIRIPLRPLASVLRVRARGGDPAMIEAQARAKRMRKQRKREKRRAEGRLVLMAMTFFLAFCAVGWKMALVSTAEPVEPQVYVDSSPVINQRANIIDRNGVVLATNLPTASLYAHPQEMIDPVAAVDGLVAIFPDLDGDLLLRQFTGTRRFVWVKHKMSPEQQQMVHDIGEPGLNIGPREIRFYPNENLAAHILGGTRFGEEDVSAAEVIGVAGVELTFDQYLRDPANMGEPLQLSIDLTAQTTLRQVLAGGMARTNAKAAAAILMEADTGRIVAMVSLPDFDPNHRPRPPVSGDPAESPLFNRAAQGKYELGSTFKIFTAALAMETGVAGPDTMVNTRSPMMWHNFKISDFHNYGPRLSLVDVIVHSSNVGAARLALGAGAEAQQDLLRRLGFFDVLPVELPEARRSKPLLPPRWSEISTITVSYGHGISATPLHLATAYAAMVNGGLRVRPTLLQNDIHIPTEADRVISQETSDQIRRMMRQVVTRGTASMGDAQGYEVGGKTGSADKPNPAGGGYLEDALIGTFASAFPMSDPKYVLVVMLDEPVETIGSEARRTAGWTAVPVAAEIIRRVAPLLGLRPNSTPEIPDENIRLTRN